MVIAVNKPVGLTPLQAVERFKARYREHADAPIGYAGRLDPMAEGVVLLLIGDDTAHQKHYSNLDKTYRLECLFGIGTDSHDLLGIVQEVDSGAAPSEDEARRALHSFLGAYTFRVPAFSSVRVNKRPLFWWSRHNAIDTIVIPQRTTTITNIAFNNMRAHSKASVRARVRENVRAVVGDFRQDAVIASWDNALLGASQEQFMSAVCTMHCTSGTYIRAVARDYGARLFRNAVVMRLIRTAVGEYSVEHAVEV